LDVPTGNIPAAEAARLAKHPMVAKVMPLALGDSIAGFRIVGSEHGYVGHYGAGLASGRLWQAPMEAVAGAEAARQLGLKLGSEFVGSHGLVPGGPVHADDRYRVVGVLAPTGGVLDRLLLTGIESVWAVHRHRVLALPPEAEREVTALLVSYRTPLAAVRLPREINAQSALQAAAPALELARLLDLVGVGLTTLRGFGLLLVASAGLGIFVALFGALDERRYDIAVLRGLGARSADVFALVLLQGLLLSAAGALVGLGLAHGAAAAMAWQLPEARAMGLDGAATRLEEVYLLAAALAVGAFAAALPALKAYRTDVAATLGGS
jgi:putative ABC transport system permease protein